MALKKNVTHLKRLSGLYVLFFLSVEFSARADESTPLGNVIIHEVMANPVGLTDFPETEYVEIHNASDSSISLNGWKFMYGATSVSLPDTTLPAGSFAILYRAGRAIYIDPGGLDLPIATFPANLANTGRLLQLENSLGEFIDSMSYPAAKPATSWERDSMGSGYWSTDTRGGTPGSVNSPKTIDPPVVVPVDHSKLGDVLINEVMANPVGLTAFPETEYVEIYNASDSSISLNGWTFLYGATSVSLPDTTLLTGGFAILYRAGRTIHIDPGGLDLPIVTFPANLANTGRLLQLENSLGILIDSMSYPSAKPATSWEREASGGGYLSTDPRGGTPGSVNSEKWVEPPIVPPVDLSQPGDILITEVMANPIGLITLPETEYVEIYNASDSSISLNGWTFLYGATSVSLPDTTLSAGRFAVLYRAGRVIHIDPGGMDIAVVSFPTNLANTGKQLQLKNTSGTVIDSMTYSSAKPACSWEFDSLGEWYLSTNPRGGTPGSVNSLKEVEPPIIVPTDHSQPGDLWINEVMANPIGLTTFPETEYVELYNTSDSSICLNGWVFMYGSIAVSLPDTTLPAGSLAVLYRAGREIYVDDEGIHLPIVSFPSSLANTGRLLQLENSLGIIIDSISYSTAKPACSWERDSIGGWYLSTDVRGGTPGAMNSPISPPVIIPKPDYSQWGDLIINEIMANPIGLTTFPETEYVEIYNASDSAIRLDKWRFIYGTTTISLPDTTLPIGCYAVLYRTGREIFVDQGGLAFPIASFPINLVNSGKHLQLVNSIDLLIDSVTYQPAHPARSWERDSLGMWYASNDYRGGTPGSLNFSKEITKPPIEPEIDHSKSGDVIIHEVMADPTGLTILPETEYVEIYNVSDSAIHLKGWSFIYGSTSVLLPDTFLPTRSYAVLYRTGREIFVDQGGLAFPIASFPSSLANTGKDLQLRNSNRICIDSIYYATASAGRSWERNTLGEWYLSNDVRGGTPGSMNSPKESPVKPTDSIPGIDFIVNPQELVINEILAEPYVGGSEYIELYNRSERPLHLNGLSVAIRKADGTLGTTYPLSSFSDSLVKQDYLVITSDQKGVIDFYNTPASLLLYEMKLPALNNSGASLVLFQAKDRVIIDEVSYSSKWHDPAIRHVKGVSLERIHTDEPSQDPLNWTSALFEAGYGTPGYKNSQSVSSNSSEVVQVNIPEYLDGFDEYVIRYQTDQTGYRCRMYVFTTEGRMISEICNNQLIGLEGEIRWNGIGLDGKRLQAGLYVFFAELYHPDGPKKLIKNVFLVKPKN